jgi:pentatricopeptide repeat protein
LINKAAELIQRSLELSPLSPVVHTSLSVLELVRFRPDKAIVAARRAIELAPSGVDGYAVLGAAQLQMGLVNEGMKTLELAVRLNPVTADITYTTLTSAYFRLERIDDAVRLWERVRNENPEAMYDRLFLVNYHQGIGNDGVASRIVREILQVSPDFTVATAVDLFGMFVDMPEELQREIVTNLELAGMP